MKLKHLSIFTLCLLCIACKKEIDIDYRQVEPLYVVESSVTNKGMKARISMTNDMDDNSLQSDINHATVVVSGSDGTKSVLFPSGNGFYTSTDTGTPGVVYTIDIQVDGRHFTSTSVMQRMPVVNDFYFIRKPVMGQNFQMAKLLIQDIPDEENFYLSLLYRNGKSFKSGLKKDDRDPNNELQQLFIFGREDDDENEDLLKEGDKIQVEVRTIDRKGYDYFYSVNMSDNTGTNPLPNFTGECLGYFSAYGVVSYDYVFHVANMREEE